MSLINDALRRASQEDATAASPAGTDPSPRTPPPLQPAEPAAPSPWPSFVGLAFGLLAVLGLLGLGGWFAFKAMASARKPVLTASAREPRSPALHSTPTNAPPPAPVAQSKTVPRTSGPSEPENPGVTQSNSAPPVPVAQPPPPAANQVVKWPALRLQGIYYRPPQSSVVINNKTLFVNEEIQGVRVVEIGPQLARVTLAGQTNTLYLR